VTDYTEFKKLLAARPTSSTVECAEGAVCEHVGCALVVALEQWTAEMAQIAAREFPVLVAERDQWKAKAEAAQRDVYLAISDVSPALAKEGASVRSVIEGLRGDAKRAIASLAPLIVRIDAQHSLIAELEKQVARYWVQRVLTANDCGKAAIESRCGKCLACNKEDLRLGDLRLPQLRLAVE